MSGNVSLTIDGRTFRHAKLNPVKCIWSGFTEKGFQRTRIPMPEDPTLQQLNEAIAETKIHPLDARMHQYTFVPHCGSCMFTCPAPRFGKEDEGSAGHRKTT